MLVFPGKYRSVNPQPPLSLLHLAGALQNEGYKVRIFDMRLENYRNLKVGSPLFVGITSMSGLQIKYGLEFAKKIHSSNPQCPIIWGGVHPTLLPEQTASSRYVDIVVRGEGEATIVELANKLSTGHSIEKVKGITYDLDGRIVSTPDREFIDLDMLPPILPYDLLDKEGYPSLKAGRIHIQTSRGCPHQCEFCYNSIFNKSKWRCKSPAIVLDEIEHILREFPNVKIIDIIDDNFFVSAKRVQEICQGLIDRKIGVPWRANCRFDYMANYDKDFVNLLEQSKCVELNFGAETGSERLLSLIKKDVTGSQMIKALENLRTWAPSIEPYIFWMSGLPTETKEDLYESYRIMDKLAKVNPKTQHIEICIFTPFPSPIISNLESTFNLPSSLEEWGNIDVFHYRPPWHPKKYVDMLESISAVTKYAFYPEERIKEFGFPYMFGYKLLNNVAKFRWRHKYFAFPVELKIISATAQKLRGY